MQMAASTAARDYQKRPPLKAEVAGLARASNNAEKAGRAVQLSPQEASRLIAIENHLQSRVARSGSNAEAYPTPLEQKLHAAMTAVLWSST